MSAILVERLLWQINSGVKPALRFLVVISLQASIQIESKSLTTEDECCLIALICHYRISKPGYNTYQAYFFHVGH